MSIFKEIKIMCMRHFSPPLVKWIVIQDNFKKSLLNKRKIMWDNLSKWGSLEVRYSHDCYEYIDKSDFDDIFDELFILE